jgi:hypothetical protein
MRSDPGPTTAELLATFTDEITARGGRVTDAADDGRRLFARSVLTFDGDVRPGDKVQGGVALRAAGGEAWVHPYLFRLVCRNGSIVARTVRTRHVEGLADFDPADALQVVREAVGACCDPEAFADTLDRVRTAADDAADVMLAILPMLSRLAGTRHEQFLAQIMDQFLRDGDQSRFGAANAVTATARGVTDPALKWELEELGGGIMVADTPRPKAPPPAAAARRAVVVGSA